MYTVSGNVNCCSHYGKQNGVPKKLKIGQSYDLVIQMWGIDVNKMKTLIQKDKYTQIFTIAIFTMAKIQNQNKCLLTHEWIRSIWYIYIYIYI